MASAISVGEVVTGGDLRQPADTDDPHFTFGGIDTAAR